MTPITDIPPEILGITGLVYDRSGRPVATVADASTGLCIPLSTLARWRYRGWIRNCGGGRFVDLLDILSERDRKRPSGRQKNSPLTKPNP